MAESVQETQLEVEAVRTALIVKYGELLALHKEGEAMLSRIDEIEVWESHREEITAACDVTRDCLCDFSLARGQRGLAYAILVMSGLHIARMATVAGQAMLAQDVEAI